MVERGLGAWRPRSSSGACRFLSRGGVFNHVTCPTVQDAKQWSLQQSSQEPEHDSITWKKQEEVGGTANAHRARTCQLSQTPPHATPAPHG